MQVWWQRDCDLGGLLSYRSGGIMLVAFTQLLHTRAVRGASAAGRPAQVLSLPIILHSAPCAVPAPVAPHAVSNPAAASTESVQSTVCYAHKSVSGPLRLYRLMLASLYAMPPGACTCARS